MLPLSGTCAIAVYRVVDVDVAPCGHGHGRACGGDADGVVGAALGMTFG